MPTRTTSAIAESVSELLRQAREDAGFDVSEIAAKSKIPERYLRLFEDRISLAEAPEDAYTKIYLKAYGKFLGFESSSLVEMYRREKTRTPKSMTKVETTRRHPLTTISSSELAVAPRVVQNALLGALGVGLLGYLAYGIITAIAPPQITLLAPYEGMVTTDRRITIEGRTETEVALMINGKPVNPDQSGKFTDTIDLQEGVNTISVSGTKKHSKAMIIARRVIVLPQARPTALDGAMPVVEEVK
jgi:hypothetical protein